MMQTCQSLTQIHRSENKNSVNMKLRLLALASLMASLMMTLTEGAALESEIDPPAEDDESVTSTIAKANKALESRLSEGDIVVDRRRNAVSCFYCKWPKSRGNVVVTVHISSAYSSSEKSLIRSAMKEIQDRTCIHFYEISGWWTWFKRHLYIHSGTGCWSYIGRKFWRRKQKLSLDRNGCLNTGTIQHELLHALGFAHEHSRSDRDDHIQVLTENIEEGMEHNFMKHKTNNLQTPYDFESIMQYSNFAFSKNGRQTLISRAEPTRRFGRATSVSDNDILRVNRLYECTAYL